MSEIKFDYKNGQFFLEGVEGERFECRGVLPINDFRQPVNFYRINNNFGYVQGRINFFDSCDNNVVDSDQTDITIFNAKNSFISINNGALQVLPISEVEIVCARGLDLLKIKKKKPWRVGEDTNRKLSPASSPIKRDRKKCKKERNILCFRWL